MATLALNTLIQIGLVTTAGTVIIVPIAVSQNKGTLLVSGSSVEESSSQSHDVTAPSRLDSTDTSNLTEQHVKPPIPSEPKDTVVLEGPVASAKREEKDKKCFVIPASSNDGRKLLTCLENPNVSVTSDEYEEYGNFYFLYDSSKENKWSKIEGNLMWNPNDNQISVKLKKTTETIAKNDGIFVAEQEQWKGISDKETDLLTECALFGNGTTSVSSYRLVCGEETSEMSRENPKGIPLTPWQLNS